MMKFLSVKILAGVHSVTGNLEILPKHYSLLCLCASLKFTLLNIKAILSIMSAKDIHCKTLKILKRLKYV